MPKAGTAQSAHRHIGVVQPRESSLLPSTTTPRGPTGATVPTAGPRCRQARVPKASTAQSAQRLGGEGQPRESSLLPIKDDATRAIATDALEVSNPEEAPTMGAR